MNMWKLLIIFLILMYLFGMVLLSLFQERLIFFPDKLPQAYTFEFEQPFEEHNYTMGDDAVINALLFKAASPKGVVFYHHGNAGSLEKWGEVAASMLVYGYDVLIYDYRGYGKSTGERSMQALLEDAQTIYNSLALQYKEDQIIIYGRSLGTGIATWVASQNQPGRLILESPYYSLTHVARYHFPIYPQSKLLRYPFPTYRYINDVKCPIFMFHGEEDGVVPFRSGKKLEEAVMQKANLTFVAIPGGGHNDLQLFDDFKAWMSIAMK